MKISLGNDHAGTLYKEVIVNYLKDHNIEVVNHGTNSSDSVDYPDFAHLVAKDVSNGSSDKGILICGSGNGVAMTANKYKHIRAGLAWNPILSELTRKHNDANVICIPARFVDQNQVLEIVKKFLDTSFEGGRHASRVRKIAVDI